MIAGFAAAGLDLGGGGGVNRVSGPPPCLFPIQIAPKKVVESKF